MQSPIHDNGIPSPLTVAPPAPSRWRVRIAIVFIMFFSELIFEIVAPTEALPSYTAQLYIALLEAFLNTLLISVIWASIAVIRVKDSGHVYTLWYLFCFVTIVGLLAYLYLDTEGVIILTGDGVEVSPGRLNFWGSTLQRYLEFSRDLKGELHFLFILLLVVLAPQATSFLASGLFGCGASPVLVSRITKLSLLSLIKCLCVVAAFDMAEYIFLLHIGPGGWYYSRLPFHSLEILFPLTGAFLLSAVYSRFERIIVYIPSVESVGILSRIWGFATRHSQRME